MKRTPPAKKNTLTRPKWHFPVDNEIEDIINEMEVEQAQAEEEVAKMHEILRGSLWRDDNDFLNHMASRKDDFHTYMFVDMDNHRPPTTQNALSGVALICVGTKDSFKVLLEDPRDHLRNFYNGRSLFCFACGDYSEATDDRINFLGIELGRVTRNLDKLFIFISHDRVYSITAQGVRTQNSNARTSCIYYTGKIYFIQQAIDGALKHLHRREPTRPTSEWLPMRR